MTQDLSAIRWPITTPRLRIRPATADDADATYAIRSRDDVSTWITSATTHPVDYRARFVDPDRLAKTLVIERGDDPGPPVGDLMLSLQDGWAQAEVRDDAVAAMLRACFTELGVRRVVASCFADNTASRRLMERLGMRREAVTVRDALHRSGRWLDSCAYALLADEWRTGREPA